MSHRQGCVAQYQGRGVGCSHGSSLWIAQRARREPKAAAENLTKTLFRIKSIEGNQAKPIYFRNDYVGVEHATVPEYFGNVPVKPRLQHSLDSFVADWWASTREQGFFQRAEELHAEQAKAAGEQGRSKESWQEHADRYTTWLASFPEPSTEATANAKKPQEAAVPTAEDHRLQRVEKAEKALSVYTDQDREANLTDLLADAMHWSREQKIDFDRCLELAKGHYQTEVHEMQEELSRKAEKHEERGIAR